MKSLVRQRGLRWTLILAAVGTVTATAVATSALAAAPSASRAHTTCLTKVSAPTHVGHIGGIVNALPIRSGCAHLTAGKNGLRIPGNGDNAIGFPPLVWHGGAVMGTKLTGDVVVTPIFWNPAGFPMTDAYKSIITQYLSDVAKASNRNDNVFSILTDYFGTDGQVRYRVDLGTPINDTNPFPSSGGCIVDPTDTSGIYADNSGYSACLDDAQIITETNNVVAANGLPVNLSHIYVMYTPKGVESCFFPGSTTTSANACTINHQPSAAYCAYHSQAPNANIYANMPFPIYQSSVGFTCGTDARFPVIETPNGNADADVEISPTSHEISEAITDPDTQTGWYDTSGFEIGDECAYVFGPTQGTPGALYNQVINRHHYITQEEFSNNSFFSSGGGCLQGANGE